MARDATHAHGFHSYNSHSEVVPMQIAADCTSQYSAQPWPPAVDIGQPRSQTLGSTPPPTQGTTAVAMGVERDD